MYLIHSNVNLLGEGLIMVYQYLKHSHELSYCIFAVPFPFISYASDLDMKPWIFSVILDTGFKSIVITFSNFQFTHENVQIIARFCPHFFNGSEKELVKLLKDNNNNDMIREGILTILAKAGGTIREQLSVTSRCYCQTHELS